MKPLGSPHPDRALSAVHARQPKKPGRYTDGNGLYLVVDPSGAKRWLLRTVVQGRRRDIGLGSARLVGLAEAREKATHYRRIAREGGDPLQERDRERQSDLSFAEAAEKVHAEHRRTWRNEKHAEQWLTTLKTYVFPELGARRVRDIGTPDILRVLAPIWLSKPETARRVRQRMGAVLDWATASGHRQGENPVKGVGKGLPKQTDRHEHHAALAYDDLPAFLEWLDGSANGEIPKLALEFLILTAGRTGEVIGSRWTEFDLEGRLWVVPASRMKAKREHRVPLSHRAIWILERAASFTDGGSFVFPGRTVGRPLSNMAMLMLLRRRGLSATTHGFRSTFRDWAAELTSFPREVAEQALAHTISNQVEAAYRRGDLLAKRRELMEAWARFARPRTKHDS